MIRYLLSIGVLGSCAGFKPILCLCLSAFAGVKPKLNFGKSIISADKHRRNIGIT